MLEWLASKMTDNDLEALAKPLLLDKNGVPLDGVPGKDLKAFLDPTTYLNDGRADPDPLPLRPNPLNLTQMIQAARFTRALYRLLQALTGHEGIAVHTFKEVLISSTGIFPWYDGRFVGIYKKQPYIGRGSSLWRIGRPGRFILPHERKLVMDITLEQVKKELGWDMPRNLLNPFRPDHLIEKLDYDMTYRNRNYGIVFSYDVCLDADMFGTITTPTGDKPVLVLENDDPHPSDEDMDAGKYARVLRLMSAEDLERENHGERLTLEAELPRLLEMFRN